MKTKRKNIFKSLLALTLALIMVLGAAPLSELAGVDWASLFAPKAEAEGKLDCLEDMPLISESHYTGNQGDSCVFNLNRKGLPGIDNKYYRNGNVGVDGTVYNNGFEVSNPANGAKIALDKEKQRELIIFDAIRDVLGSPEFSDIISTSAASDLVGWTKSLNSAAKKIYGAEGIKTFEDFYKKYGEDTSSGKKKTKALVEAAYEDYRQDVGAVNCLSDLLTCVDSVLKIAKSSKEVINAFVNCMMVARMRESLKAVIDEMYAQSTDSDMRTALGNVKNYCVSEMDALRGTMVRSVAGIGVTVLKEFVGDFWGDLASMVPIAGPIIKGVQIGAAAGEGICNMLFSTGNTRDNYYLAKSTVEFVDIARKASMSLQKKYSANRTTEAANAYIDSVRLYISVLNLDAENGRKFCKTACNDGLINGVSNWINGGNAKYDEIERCTNSIQKSNKEFIDLISISWILQTII